MFDFYTKKTFLYFLFSLFLLSCGIFPAYFSKNAKQAGQTAPPDMVFIEGKGEMESFYISATEEPNINYVLYLKWIDRVFEEAYPEVIRDAMPKKHNNDFVDGINDPYLQSYLTHPAFAYYPVTNLTWEQIQNYLAWKTNRLNESILIEKGILNSNPGQQDEDNFNTEAYLSGQYVGDVRNNVCDKEYLNRERSVLFKDGILFTGFRLPTESEWEYANQPRFRSTKAKKYKGTKVLYHSFGKNYYHLKEGRIWFPVWKDTGPYRGCFDCMMAPKRQREYTFNSLENYSFNAKDYKNKTLPKLDQTPFNYENIPADYGMINMENGVKEWVIDKYEPRYTPENNWKTAYEKAGFLIGLETGKRLDPDPDGYIYVDKDTLGRMQDFRFVDVNSDGLPYEMGYDFSDKKNYKRVIKGGTAQKSGNFRAAMEQNKWAEDVGFRCVLPYTGQPPRNGKVRW